MQVVIETIPEALHLSIEFFFSGVSKRRVADIVRKCQRFGQIFIEPQSYSSRAGNLSDLDRMCQPITKVIMQSGSEDLSLVFKPPECARVHNPVTVALELITIGMGELRITPALRTLDGKPKAGQRGPAQ